MNTLTLYRPWSSLLVFPDLKSIETRTPRPGSAWERRLAALAGQTIAIHAGQVWGGLPPYWLIQKYQIDESRIDEAAEHAAQHRGCVVGVVEIVAARWLSAEDERAALCDTEGRFGLFTANSRRFAKPIAVAGRQGIWRWEPPPDWEGLLIQASPNQERAEG